MLDHIGQLTTNPFQLEGKESIGFSEKEFFKGLGQEIAELQKRINELEVGIRKHHDTFPDEALEGEIELWKLVGIEEKERNFNCSWNETK